MELRDECAQRNLCMREIKVEEPVHRDSPILSALETLIHWHKESLFPETSSAALDGHAFFHALTRPLHSTVHCCSAFLTVEACWCFLPISLPRAVFTCWVSKPLNHPGSVTRQLPSTWFSRPVESRCPGCGRCACYRYWTSGDQR